MDTYKPKAPAMAKASPQKRTARFVNTVEIKMRNGNLPVDIARQMGVTTDVIRGVIRNHRLAGI